MANSPVNATFDARARTTLQQAEAESRRRDHPYIGTEHVLLALLAIDDDDLTAYLGRLKLDRSSLAARIDEVIQRGKPGALPESILPFTSRTHKSLELAVAEARRTNVKDVGPEHLLIGLRAERKNIAAQVLAEAGVTEESARLALTA